jgi:hypothetical protein
MSGHQPASVNTPPHPPARKNDRTTPDTATPRVRTGLLDYGWWASDGPSAGYIASLALDEIADLPATTRHAARGIDLYLLRLPAGFSGNGG